MASKQQVRARPTVSVRSSAARSRFAPLGTKGRHDAQGRQRSCLEGCDEPVVRHEGEADGRKSVSALRQTASKTFPDGLLGDLRGVQALWRNKEWAGGQRRTSRPDLCNLGGPPSRSPGYLSGRPVRSRAAGLRPKR